MLATMSQRSDAKTCEATVIIGSRDSLMFFFFSSRRRHTRFDCDWSSDVCSSDLQIYSNYRKFTNSKDVPANLQSLDQRWEDFVDLLDVYRRRKHHLRSTNRQAVQNQLKQAEHAVQTSTDDRQKRIQQANLEILRRRVAAFNDLERSVKLVEGQLQSIENFFGLVNDQVVTLPTPERVSSLHFEELSDSIAMTRQMLEETSDTYGLLDNQHRELDLLLSHGSSSK